MTVIENLYRAMVKKINDCYMFATYTVTSSSLGKKRARIHKNWINNDIILKIKERDKRFQKWKNCNVNSLKRILRDEYVRCRNKINKLIKNEKIKYFKNAIEREKGNIKETWKNINSFIGKKDRKSVDEVINTFLGKKFSNIDIANGFVGSFIDEVNALKHKCTIITDETPPASGELQSMRMPTFNESQIKYIINQLKYKKQPGIDGVRTKDVMLLVNEMSKPITKLCNLSFKNSIVPSQLKTAIIRPVFKKGDHYKFSNYRQIAILSVFDFIMERAVAYVLTDYLTNHKIISKFQFGFQKGRSTGDLLTQLSDFINAKLNVNMHVIALFIDFTKAFDTINHDKLISILEKIGIRGPMLLWFSNYLCDRKIVVQINDSISESRHCNTGVPQGSILGPMLYLIYVNEMFIGVTNCQYYMYADDTLILAAHKSLREAECIMQSSLNNLAKFTHDTLSFS